MEPRVLVAFIGLVLMLLAGSTTMADASPPTMAFDGTAEVSINPQLVKSGGLTDPFELLVAIHGEYVARGAVATGRIELGQGLEWLSGDSVRVVDVSGPWKRSERLWTVFLRGVRPGSTTIRATVTTRFGTTRTDEYVFLLPIEVGVAAITAGKPKVVRNETVRNGKRYRYDIFLVPIEVSEEITPEDLLERAKPIHEEIVTCTGCPQQGTSIPFVVFVNAQGNINSFRLLSWGGEGKSTPEMLEAAARALKHWRFAPGRTRSKKVADCAIVSVKVRG